ncbi:hypothetical protein ILUMI_12302 [Ignelater luminosus]|uniref:Uncharacterized protein n=1 Tax=Ignelater luminosus TaxID=2038154 RepID=A0A8K0CYF3_IGNLU|nr:hypothetical protein ILUMI_12302 [Ignelater luminosus]
MKTKDYKFLALRECDAIFTANAALELADSEVCHGFRLLFVIVQRNCGQAFCSQCQQRTAALPRFGDYERLKDKLIHVKDSSAVLDTLLEGHWKRLHRQAKKAGRQRQLQIPHKLDIMRKKAIRLSTISTTTCFAKGSRIGTRNKNETGAAKTTTVFNRFYV